MFATLNVHSYYSFNWGVDSPEEICKAVSRDKNCAAVAMTDTNGLYGLFFFLDYARTFGVTPIVGAELKITSTRATLLVKNSTGYSNLCQLITKLKKDDFFEIGKELKKRSEGLVVLTESESLLRDLNGKVESLYAEIILGYPTAKLLRTARHLNIKPVATTRAFWIREDGFQVHRMNRAISLNTTLFNLKNEDCSSPEARCLSEEEMRKEFDFCLDAVDNTIEVAEKCRWLPNFGTIYPETAVNANGNSIEVLKQKALEGAQFRYKMVSSEIRKRLEYELKIIEDKGFAPVFLIVEDIVSKFPRTCGRGSAAASLVSYCLGITHVDPVKYNLFFERFINYARTDPPDIDIDFAWDERDDVLEYVFNRYSEKHSAMVANHVTFQKKAAIREVAKVYGLPDAEIGAITKRMSYGLSLIGKDVTEHPALKDHGFPPPWPEILAWAERLEDIPRYLSVHCGGVVVTPDDIANWVPTERAPKGVNIIQWEKDQTEDSGLVKIDLLGNRSLAVIRDTLRAIKRHFAIDIDYATWYPQDDAKTQRIISEGDTMGVFYIESPATRLLQKKAGVGDYNHVVLHSSMIRPAANKFIHLYLRRLKGEPFEPLHPLIGDILDENYGIMVYQEDVTKVAMRLAGFQLSEAEELRKIISKKHKHRRLIDLKFKFYEGAEQRGVTTEQTDKIWEMIMSFAGYSFCKPHSASYALVSFKSAYLRAHFPAEFMAAVVSNQGGFYSAFAYISEAKRMKLQVLPPDINSSNKVYEGFTYQQGDLKAGKGKFLGWIRVGLMQIKGLPSETIETILKNRESRDFNSFEDCMKRCALSSSDARLLVMTGCFDRIEPEYSRPELIWKIVISEKKRPSVGQGSLFNSPAKQPPEVPNYSKQTILKQEIETLGFLVSKHPLELYRKALQFKPVVQGKNLKHHVGQWIEVAGWLVTGKIVPTKTREVMEFVTFEDTTSLIETVFFPGTFKRFNHILTYVRPFRLYGKVEEDFGAITMTIERISFL